VSPEERRLDFPPYALYETRAGAGTPVALIHGLSGSTRWWSKNIEALAARHLVAAVDLIGFGSSRRYWVAPEIPPSFSEVAALVARWLRTFEEPVHVVGHSMGGLIAIRVAAEHPELVRSLVLVNAAGMRFRFDPRPHVRSLPRPPYGGPGIARVLVPDFIRAGPASVAIAGARVVLGNVQEMMHAVRAPSLLVWGENDPLVPLPYGEAMQREIAGARLVVIPRAAHVAMWDAPEAFNDAVLAFLDEVDTAPAESTASPVFSWGVAGWTHGMAHREAGTRRNAVLIHGLGMSSRYFDGLALELFRAGWDPIAPDLPGFGESGDAPASGPREHADMLAKWADALGIRDALWLGHSIGCNAVAHLARQRPDLVQKAVHVGPLWTRTPIPSLRLMAMLALDGLREPMPLYRYVLPAYWRVGIARWWLTWLRYARDVAAEPPAHLMIAGERDPIPDRRRVTVVTVPGAHACNVSHPREVVDAIRRQ
jgi:pimeloyl-ACP methyl ester carboxylesterase